MHLFGKYKWRWEFKLCFLLIIFMFLFISCINIIYAFCSSEQVNINNDSAERLQDIVNIGEVYAQRIVEYRDKQLFETLDELSEIKGIGDARLQQIKEQGLACVDDIGEGDGGEVNESNNESEDIEHSETDENINNADNKSYDENHNINYKDDKKETEDIKKNISKKIILLNNISEHKESKEHDTEERYDTEISKRIIYESKNEIIKRYAVYGFCLFLIFIIIILLFRR